MSSCILFIIIIVYDIINFNVADFFFVLFQFVYQEMTEYKRKCKGIQPMVVAPPPVVMQEEEDDDDEGDDDEN